jgi:hypothetical protein
VDDASENNKVKRVLADGLYDSMKESVFPLTYLSDGIASCLKAQVILVNDRQSIVIPDICY